MGQNHIYVIIRENGKKENSQLVILPWKFFLLHEAITNPVLVHYDATTLHLLVLWGIFEGTTKI